GIPIAWRPMFAPVLYPKSAPPRSTRWSCRAAKLRSRVPCDFGKVRNRSLMTPYQALPFADRRPLVPATAFVAAGAILVGDVSLSDQSSIWYGVVIRGDVAPVRIGARTNIQDGTVIHVSRERPE